MRPINLQTSPLQAEGDTFTRAFDAAVRLLFGLLRYLGRRSLENPLVGLAYAAVALPATLLIVQDIRQSVSTAGTPAGTTRFAASAHMWPLTEPLPPASLLALFFVIGLVIAFDRWTFYRGQTVSRNTAKQEPIRIEDWVIGRAYQRVWNPDPGEFKLVPTGELYKLGEEHLRTHMLLVAPTGAGKTRSVLEPALHFFKRTGAAVICLDAKGDDFDPGQFHFNFDLDNPSGSRRLNIWSGRTPREMGERLGEALVPDAGISKDYFVRNAKDTMAALVDAHHKACGVMASLKQLILYLRNSDAREDLIEELRRAGYGNESDEIVDMQRVAQLAEQKNDVLGGLDTALAPLARGRVASLLATGGDGYSVEQLIAQPVRARFALSVGHHPRIAPIIGRLVLSQFTYAVISPDCNKGILKAAVVDEADNFITPAIAKGMAMARENRGCYILALQNLMQIENPTLREDILSVAGNKLVMAGVGDYDAEKFSRIFGSRERLYVAHSQNASQGTNNSTSQGSGREVGDLLDSTTGSLRQQNSQVRSTSSHHSQGSNSQVRERADFLPSEIRELPQFHLLIERRDSRGRATPATVVNMDYELISGVIEIQALRQYEHTRRIEEISPNLAGLTDRIEGHNHRDCDRASEQTHQQAITVCTSRHPTTKDTIAPALHPDAGPDSSRYLSSTTIPSSDAEGRDYPTGLNNPYPQWVDVSAHEISSLLGIDGDRAHELARIAFDNGRDASYLSDNIEYVKSAPKVKNPTGLFTFLVNSNRHKTKPANVKMVGRRARRAEMPPDEGKEQDKEQGSAASSNARAGNTANGENHGPT